jgi:hypothetical protein
MRPHQIPFPPRSPPWMPRWAPPVGAPRGRPPWAPLSRCRWNTIGLWLAQAWSGATACRPARLGSRGGGARQFQHAQASPPSRPRARRGRRQACYGRSRAAARLDALPHLRGSRHAPWWALAWQNAPAALVRAASVCRTTSIWSGGDGEKPAGLRRTPDASGGASGWLSAGQANCLGGGARIGRLGCRGGRIAGCRFRATTLCAASHPAGRGEGGRQNAVSAQRPYTRGAGRAERGGTLARRATRLAGRLDGGMRFPRNDPMRGSQPGWTGGR